MRHRIIIYKEHLAAFALLKPYATTTLIVSPVKCHLATAAAAKVAARRVSLLSFQAKVQTALLNVSIAPKTPCLPSIHTITIYVTG